MARWDAFQSFRWLCWVCEKNPSLLLGGSINSGVQSGSSAGWISTYCLKDLEQGYSVRHFCMEAFVFSSSFEICIPFNKTCWYKNMYAYVFCLCYLIEKMFAFLQVILFKHSVKQSGVSSSMF